MSLAARWESEDTLISDVKPPRQQPGALAYEPFVDDDGPVDVTSWPPSKPVPTTVRKWDGGKSAPAKEGQ